VSHRYLSEIVPYLIAHSYRASELARQPDRKKHVQSYECTFNYVKWHGAQTPDAEH